MMGRGRSVLEKKSCGKNQWRSVRKSHGDIEVGKVDGWPFQGLVEHVFLGFADKASGCGGQKGGQMGI